MALLCDICIATVLCIKLLLSLGLTDVAMQYSITNVCYFLQNKHICDGVVRQFRNDLFIVIKTSHASDFCSLMLNSACQGTTPQMSWVVPLNSTDRGKYDSRIFENKDESQGESVRFVQIADIHIDYEYQVGAPTQCDYSICCRNVTSSKAANNQKLAGKWGSSYSCDLPELTFVNMLEFITKNVQFDFVLMSGDFLAHDVWQYSRETHVANLGRVFRLLRQYFPNVGIIFAVGNHESVPVDTFPPLNSDDNNSTLSWLYKNLYDAWSPWLPSGSYETFVRGGYYVYRNFKPGLRIISLNTNYCNIYNVNLLLRPFDPANQLQWFRDELQNAEETGDCVYIVGHITPGSPDCYRIWTSNYHTIINRYKRVIRGQFFSHEHSHEFKVYLDPDDSQKPILVANIGPTAGTYSVATPSFALYTTHQNSLLSDIETYHFDIWNANKTTANWYKIKSFKEEFEMKSLETEEFLKLVNRLQQNNTLFEKFYRNHFIHDPNSTSNCDQNCKQNLLSRFLVKFQQIN